VSRSAPALAPLLGVIGLATAFPALAGQAVRPLHRAALGALGLWWLLLAEALTGHRLLLGSPPGAQPRGLWQLSASDAFTHAVAPLVTSGALAVAAVWALMAVLLPVVVRGRAAALDIVAATAWAAALAAGTRAAADALTWHGGAPSPRGVVAGAVVAGLIAVGARAVRGAPQRPG
jgi:hypothetical protein